MILTTTGTSFNGTLMRNARILYCVLLATFNKWTFYFVQIKSVRKRSVGCTMKKRLSQSLIAIGTRGNDGLFLEV